MADEARDVNRASNRYFGIDVLRGISILAVLLLHLDIRGKFPISQWGKLLPRELNLCLFRSGYHGVVVFFAVSGFIVTLSALRRWPSAESFRARDFYLLRVARILPLLLLVVGIMSVLHWLGVEHYAIPAEHTSLGRVVLAALGFHINWLEHLIGQYLPANWDVMWTLSVEESFYLTFPLVFLLVRRPKQFVPFVLLFFFFVSPWAREEWMSEDRRFGGHNHLAFVDCLLLGVSTALVATQVQVQRALRIGCFLLGVTLLVALFGRIMPGMHFLGSHGFFESTLAIGACLVMFAIFQSPRDSEPRFRWSLDWLASMGRYSYEIYLTHSFVVLEITRGWNKNARPESLALLCWYVVAVFLSFALGKVLATRIFDPLNQALRRRWIQHLAATRTLTMP